MLTLLCFDEALTREEKTLLQGMYTCGLDEEIQSLRTKLKESREKLNQVSSTLENESKEIMQSFLDGGSNDSNSKSR